jgi:hypothetical protein
MIYGPLTPSYYPDVQMCFSNCTLSCTPSFLGMTRLPTLPIMFQYYWYLDYIQISAFLIGIHVHLQKLYRRSSLLHCRQGSQTFKIHLPTLCTYVPSIDSVLLMGLLLHISLVNSAHNMYPFWCSPIEHSDLFAVDCTLRLCLYTANKP